MQMNPIDFANSVPNYWLSCMIINPDAMCKQVRGEQEALYLSEPGKSCPTEILEALMALNAEGRPIWKPMHMQPTWFAGSNKYGDANFVCSRQGWHERKDH